MGESRNQSVVNKTQYTYNSTRTLTVAADNMWRATNCNWSRWKRVVCVSLFVCLCVCLVYGCHVMNLVNYCGIDKKSIDNSNERTQKTVNLQQSNCTKLTFTMEHTTSLICHLNWLNNLWFWLNAGNYAMIGLFPVFRRISSLSVNDMWYYDGLCQPISATASPVEDADQIYGSHPDPKEKRNFRRMISASNVAFLGIWFP